MVKPTGGEAELVPLEREWERQTLLIKIRADIKILHYVSGPSFSLFMK